MTQVPLKYVIFHLHTTFVHKFFFRMLRVATPFNRVSCMSLLPPWLLFICFLKKQMSYIECMNVQKGGLGLCITIREQYYASIIDFN